MTTKAAERRSGSDDRMHVLIADHDGLARSMMRSALQQHQRVAMVTTAGDARDALDLARYYRPGVMLVDTGLPPGGLAELIAEVLGASPDTRVLTVSVDDDEAALAALRVGAVGHVDKDVDPAEVAELAVRAVDGEVNLPQRLLASLLDVVQGVPDAGWRPVRSRLTTREWEIVEHLGEGASTQHIAERLVLSPTTVYSHVKSVMRKLGVHSRRDITAAAESLRRDEALGEKRPQSCADKFTAVAG